MGTRDIAIHGVLRYAPILQLLRDLGGGTLLEVGSAHSGIRGYGLTEPEWAVTVLDKSFDNYGQAEARALPRGSSLVQGDARELPFEDGAFDVTLALDLLEHIAPADRPRVLSELGRVSSRKCIVGCPTGSRALEADRRLQSFVVHRGLPVPGWLGEHFEYGFPESGDLREALAGFGHVQLLGNENLRAHERIMKLHLLIGWTPPVRALVGALRSACTRRSVLAAKVAWRLRGRDSPPVYRTIAVVHIDRH